jgi:hypothetical protein
VQAAGISKGEEPMRNHRRKPTLRGALWVAAPLAACLAGCCKTEIKVVPPDELPVAAQRGLERVLDGLGKDAPNGAVRKAFEVFVTGAGNQPTGLGLSLAEFRDKAVYKEHGLYTAFTIDSQGKTIGRLASFLNGPTSPLHGWKGWRYRSGIIDEQHEPANNKVATKLSLTKEALEAGPPVTKNPKQMGPKPAEESPSPVPQLMDEAVFESKEKRALGERSMYVVLYEETTFTKQVQR